MVTPPTATEVVGEGLLPWSGHPESQQSLVGAGTGNALVSQPGDTCPLPFTKAATDWGGVGWGRGDPPKKSGAVTKRRRGGVRDKEGHQTTAT